MTLDEFNDLALSVPFRVGGRDYTGWDCWGLIYCAYRDVFNDPIKSFAHEYTAHSFENRTELHDLITREWAEWLPTETPVVGDVGLYRLGRHYSHVALVVPHSRMLHCERRPGTISERLDNAIWARRNVGFFKRSRS